jgi:hypothetical protein
MQNLPVIIISGEDDGGWQFFLNTDGSKKNV